MKQQLNRFLFTVFVFTFTWVSYAVELTATNPGTIILPDQPSITEEFAGEELQHYVGRILGSKPAITSEGSERPDGPRIFIGQTQMGSTLNSKFSDTISDVRSDSFVRVVDDEKVILLGGGDRGTLYAVYALLEEAGCRWIEPLPNTEIIPSLSQFSPEKGDVVFEPVFAVREIGRNTDGTPEGTLALIDWEAKNRINRNFSLRYPLGRNLLAPENKNAIQKRGGHVQWQHICHNTPWMFPNDPLFEEKPHMYALYKGRRLPIGMEEGYICTTHPESIQTAADFIKKWFDRHPNGTVVPVSPPDGAVVWCEHDACMALGGRNFTQGDEGHMTRRQVEFINDIARKVALSHPDKYILNLAYSKYVWPYPGMAVESNVITQICHGYAGNGSLVKPITHPRNAEAKKIFETWAEAGGSGIGIWDYFILQVEERSGSPKTPLGFGVVAEDMIKFLADFDKPYKVYFTQAGRELHTYNPFLYYAIARLTWDPSETITDLRKDYADSIFGPAGIYVDAYLEELDHAYLVSEWEPGFWRNIAVPSPLVFTREVLATLFEHLNAAEKTVDNDNEYAQDVLRRMRISLEYVETAVTPKMLLGDDGVWALERGETGYRFNAGAKTDNTEEVKLLQARAEERGLLDEAMRKVFFRSEARTEKMVRVENQRVRLDILPGVGGRIVRIIDLKHGNNLLHEPMDITTLVDPGAGYFRYGGYEEYTRKMFGSPGWEFAMDHTVRETPNGKSILLKGITHEGIDVERMIHIGGGTDPVIQMATRLTNKHDTPTDVKIRIHPEFKLSDDLSDVSLFYKNPNGKMALNAIDKYTAAPGDIDGVWGVVNNAGIFGILNAFDPQKATVHLHMDRNTESFNLEVFGKDKTLAPGESIQFKHTYKVLSGEDELSFILPKDRANAEKDPTKIESFKQILTDNVEFEAGLIKQGARVKNTRTLMVPGVSSLIDQAGTVSLWIKFDGPVDATENEILFSMGQRAPDYVGLSIIGGKLTFYRLVRDVSAPYGSRGWTKVQIEIGDWNPGTWRHAAAVWSRADDQPDAVELYLDGEIASGRYDLEMIPFEGDPAIGFGYHTDSFKQPRTKGVIDEVAVFNQALTAFEIKSIHQFAKMNRPFTGNPHTVFYLDFDGTIEVNPSMKEPSTQIRQQRHRELLKK